MSEYRFANQSGVALAVSMILLFIITMLSVSAMRSTNIDTKMTINHQFKQLSFQAAESAFAKLLGPAPDVYVPPTTPGASADNSDYYSSTSVAHQPDVSADVRLVFVEKTKKYKFSGFPIGTTSLIYQADAIGEVDGNNAVSHNSMEVARLVQ
jgi:type IV pilus assembly protein PilX